LTVKILAVLNKLAELENAVGKIYEWLSTLFPNDKKAADFFYRMSVEEQAHCEHVKFQIRKVRSAPKEFGEVEVDVAAIDGTLAEIARFRTTTPGINDAIRFALFIETNVAEQYATAVMPQSNKEFADFLEQLTGPVQKKHYREFIDFANSYRS
jgi:hypothetical protein